jgi:hypothetical protein
VNNIWDFSKLKHKEPGDPANLKLEVSKLINNVCSTAPIYNLEIKAAYTYQEVQLMITKATLNLKTHLINKLALSYKEYVQEPESLNVATNIARAMWKRKNLSGQTPKIQNLTMTPITCNIEDTLNN